MIKKIKDSLAAKVFLLSLLMFILCSFLTYLLIAIFMPKTYSLYLNDTLAEKAEQFVSRLESVDFDSSGALFDNFIGNPDISTVELMDENGASIPLPSLQSTYTGSTVIVSDPDLGEPTTAQSYDFSFLNDDSQYTLIVYGNAQPVSQIRQSILQTAPVILCLIIVLAAVIAFLFSRVVTKPVLKISSVAKNMSQLSLDWDCEENRTDELGVLQKSLNILSRSLSTALSDLQKANSKLQGDIEKEKALEKERMEFFSAVSHELKTPITVIKGQLEGMLLDVGAYKDHKKYLTRSLEVANTMESMVQEILTISRLETSGVSIVHSQFDIAQHLKTYLSSTEDLMIRKNLTLHTDIEVPALVSGDRRLLSKVIGNLISNAIFYSPPDHDIYITAKTQSGKFRFRIENTGVHIPDEALTKIFEPFYRVDQSRSRQTGGSGLGLYIVQKILEQHGSECNVSNTERGVCFSFFL